MSDKDIIPHNPAVQQHAPLASQSVVRSSLLSHGPLDQAANAVLTVPAQDSSVKQNPKLVIVLPAAKQESNRNIRRPRGSDDSLSSIWTRHHALCTMAVIADVKLGGLAQAREVSQPLNSGIKPREVAALLAQICPWIIQPYYLNLGNTAAMSKGIVRCARDWACNRVYYFYRKNEHPVYRSKANLRAAYPGFYAKFHDQVRARQVIDQTEAEDFWLSVSKLVPFQQPPYSAEETNVVPAAQEVVSATGLDSSAGNTQDAFTVHNQQGETLPETDDQTPESLTSTHDNTEDAPSKWEMLMTPGSTAIWEGGHDE